MDASEPNKTVVPAEKEKVVQVSMSVVGEEVEGYCNWQTFKKTSKL